MLGHSGPLIVSKLSGGMLFIPLILYLFNHLIRMSGRPTMLLEEVKVL